MIVIRPVTKKNQNCSFLATRHQPQKRSRFS